MAFFFIAYALGLIEDTDCIKYESVVVLKHQDRPSDTDCIKYKSVLDLKNQDCLVHARILFVENEIGFMAIKSARVDRMTNHVTHRLFLFDNG